LLEFRSVKAFSYFKLFTKIELQPFNGCCMFSDYWISFFRNCLPFYWMVCMKIWIVWNKSLTLKWRIRTVGQMRRLLQSVGEIIWLGMIHWSLMYARWVYVHVLS